MSTDQIEKTPKVAADFGKGSREQSQSGPRRKLPERYVSYELARGDRK